MSTKVLIQMGKLIRQAREKRDWTQEELADRAGLHFTYIGQVERGTRNLTVESLQKIAKALRVRGGDLLPF